MAKKTDKIFPCPNPLSTKILTKKVFLLLGFVSLLFVIYEMVSVFKRLATQNIIATPTSPTPIVNNTIENIDILPESDNANRGWLKWDTGKRADNFSPFTIYYPNDWEIKASSSKSHPDSSFVLVLTKGTSSIIIKQIDAGYGWCVFPSEKNDGIMTIEYDTMSRVNRVGSYLWKIGHATNTKPEIKSVCDKGQYLDC